METKSKEAEKQTNGSVLQSKGTVRSKLMVIIRLLCSRPPTKDGNRCFPEVCQSPSCFFPPFADDNPARKTRNCDENSCWFLTLIHWNHKELKTSELLRACWTVSWVTSCPPSEFCAAVSQGSDVTKCKTQRRSHQWSYGVVGLVFFCHWSTTF